MIDTEVKNVTQAAILYARCYLGQIEGQTELAESLIERAASDPANRHLYAGIAQELIANMRKGRDDSEKAASLLKEVTDE